MASTIIDSIIEEVVKAFAELVMQNLNVSSIYLYGSYAKGDFTEDSDIDIAVICDDFSGDPVEDTLKLMRIRRKIDNRIEPHPFRVDEFERLNPYVLEIINTGIKIV